MSSTSVNRLFAAVVGASLLTAGTPALARQPEAVLKDAGEKIVNFAVPGLGSSIFGSHSKVQPYQVDGKWVYALALRDEKGSRCTLNFDAKWKGEKKFKAYVLGVGPEVRATMQFQRKGDKKWGEDSNRGPAFKHGDVVVIDGGKNYLAQRGFETADILKSSKHVAIVFLEDGLSFEKFMDAMR